MTPKEKAEYLVNIFINYAYDKDSANVCAYKSVDEILKLDKKLPLETFEYYSEVLSEIIKL
jgi:hypothetical protein